MTAFRRRPDAATGRLLIAELILTHVSADKLDRCGEVDLQIAEIAQDGLLVLS